MRKTSNAILTLCAMAASAICSYGQDSSKAAAFHTDIQSEAEEIMHDPAFSQSTFSICAMTGDGRTILDINSGTMLVPASNMKLITTGAAISSLGPDFRYSTSIGYSGTVTSGVLHGDLYIIGGGDPTLGSKDSIATEIGKTFSQWEAMLRKEGIRKIEGHIIGDGRWYGGMAEEPTWLWNDIGTYYGTGATGLMFYENMQSFLVSPGKAEGEPVNISPTYPQAPWMEFRYSCSTGKAGTGDQLYMYTSELAPAAEIRGTFGADMFRKRVDCSNKFPEYTCAKYFADYLDAHGIPCTKGPGDFKLDRTWMDSDEQTGTKQTEIKTIGKTESPALSRIVFETNHASNNLYAETLLRTLGKTICQDAEYGAAIKAMTGILEKLGISTSKGIHAQDGSGLSRQNYVSAEFFCKFLTAMMDTPHFEDFASSLPSPGENGTLRYNMKNTAAQTRERIKVKSGSMNGVRCYSGYVIPREGCKDETIVFSILVNNCTSPNWKTKPMLDRLMESIALMN